MQKNKKMTKMVVILLLLITVVAAVSYANILFSRSSAGGTDFLVHWMGTRSFLIDGVSPYSDATALKIQTEIYGRAALPGEHEFRVAYPLYSMVLFAPFALVADFNVARGLWMTLLEACLFGIGFIGLKFVKQRAPFWLAMASVFFVIFSYHGIRPLINGNAVIVVALLIALALYEIVHNRDEAGGLLLAFATIKPQNAVLIVAFVLIWAIIQHRKRIVYWFFAAMILLVGFTMLLIPDWIVQFLREVLRYASYNPPGSPGAIMIQAWGDIGMRLSVFLSVIIAGILLAEWIDAFKGGMRHFLLTAFLTLALGQWIGIQTDPGNFVLLFPGMLFCFEVLLLRWGLRAKPIILGTIGFLIVSLWILYLTTMKPGPLPLQSPALFFPLPFVAILLLYWTKWWVLRSPEVQGL